jgi:hypothetical protein
MLKLLLTSLPNSSVDSVSLVFTIHQETLSVCPGSAVLSVHQPRPELAACKR